VVEIFSGLQTGVAAQTDLIIFPIGFITAVLSGFLCIRFLLDYLHNNNLITFAFYRWPLAVLIIVVALIRR
jgi:undecaprenyl-diphosphatase